MSPFAKGGLRGIFFADGKSLAARTPAQEIFFSVGLVNRNEDKESFLPLTEMTERSDREGQINYREKGMEI